MVEIVLLQDVAKIGKKGEVARVSAGYAQFLIKQNKAQIATEKAKKMAKQLLASTKEKLQKTKDTVKKAIEKLGDTLVLKLKANEQGHLFEKIDAKKIASYIKEETGLEISPDIVLLEAPLKEVGEYEVELKLDDLTGKISIKIEALDK